MPTVFLVDCSLSMVRPASLEEGSPTRLELARVVGTWFFDYISQYFPLEYTTLVNFSSNCDVTVPFTRDYIELKSKLKEISVKDRTDLQGTLAVVVDVISREWGSFAPCQVVLVTDGSPGVKHLDLLKRPRQSFCTPFPCQISALCLASENELTPLKVDGLCETVGISKDDVYIPAGVLCEESVKVALTKLVKKCFLPFVTNIRCGHLSTRVGLTPSPYMLQTNFNISVSSCQTFPPLESKLGDLLYPNEMRICGFIDIGSIPAPPHYARHFVLDPLELKDSFEIGKEASTDEAEAESGKPSFRVLLHGGLKCESKAALLKLE